MTDDLIPLLKEAIAKATPGPWEQTAFKLQGFDLSVVAPAGDAELGNWLIAGVRWQTNAAYIALANPANISSLLARLEEAERERDDFKQSYDLICVTVEWQDQRVTAAEARVKALEGQRDEAREWRDRYMRELNIAESSLSAAHALLREAADRLALTDYQSDADLTASIRAELEGGE